MLSNVVIDSRELPSILEGRRSETVDLGQIWPGCKAVALVHQGKLNVLVLGKPVPGNPKANRTFLIAPAVWETLGSISVHN